ncbi:sensor histidine kinase [Arthrobacter russicus]|uniref:histidine kinase n=2 Tax=Arthrobacter russicus TaxID=172040 RepID=A0ABU1JEN8_9MICC|nr:sensor histidine kinase [Arthrobacter russicus]MDR6270904.1 sensor histidine kinase regulating citrate/malate metabolism [Arthrobacter russicus]
MRDWSIARRLFLGQFLFILLLTAGVVTAAYFDASDRAYSQATERTSSIAATLADSPLLLEAAASPDPTALLQPYAEAVIQETKVDFITIMAPDRTRWTHPNPEKIGLPYIGSVDQALSGHRYTETIAGTLGPSLRTIVPVLDRAGAVQAMVSVGVTVSALDIASSGRIPFILLLGAGLLAVGTLTSWLLGRYLKRVTLGWGPERMGQLFSYYESVLHSVRDGLLLVDRKGELVMYNDQAADLLGIPRPADGVPRLPLEALPVRDSLKELLLSGRSVRDEIHVIEDRLLVVSQEPASMPGAKTSYGTVSTLQDHTELRRMGDELSSTRTLSDALRAQTHEHANRLHTVVSLLELGRTEQALAFATEDLRLSQQLVDEVVDADREPVLAALVMGKIAQAAELGIELRVEGDTGDSAAGFELLSAHDVVTIVGNLLDNAMDAARSGTPPRWVALAVAHDESALRLRVSDSGPGLGGAEPATILERGFSTKAADATGRGIGLALVQQSVLQLGGSLQISPDAEFTVTVPRTAPAGPA